MREIKALLSAMSDPDAPVRIRMSAMARMDALSAQIKALRILVEASGTTTMSAPEANPRRERR
jgi:hypothetical protein